MGKVRAALRAMLLGAIVVGGLGGAAQTRAGSGEACAPWPGEPTPLPGLQDEDPVLARWAELRAAELAERAQILEPYDRLMAHRLWLRLRCFDPASPELRQGLHRTRPVRIHRPEVEVARSREAALEGLGWDVLGQPLAVGNSSQPRADRSRFLASIDRWVGQVEEGLRAARFDDALAAAVRARSLLERMRWDDDLQPRWVRLEVAEATVQIALGREAEARACAQRALERHPELSLDEGRHPPRLVRIFESARSEREAQL